MPATTTGFIETPFGSKYLQQLCKHFAHKIVTEFDETQGQCHFAFGTAYMSADPKGLTVRFELHADTHKAQAQSVIDSHLERFAYRENIKAMVWQG